MFKLSEPTDIILEQALLATDHHEQCAIVGRLAHHLGFRFEKSSGIVDHGVKSSRFVNEAKRRGISASILVEMLINRITADDIFDAVLDGKLTREKWLARHTTSDGS